MYILYIFQHYKQFNKLEFDIWHLYVNSCINIPHKKLFFLPFSSLHVWRKNLHDYFKRKSELSCYGKCCLQTLEVLFNFQKFNWIPEWNDFSSPRPHPGDNTQVLSTPVRRPIRLARARVEHCRLLIRRKNLTFPVHPMIKFKEIPAPPDNADWGLMGVAESLHATKSERIDTDIYGEIKLIAQRKWNFESNS